MKTLLPNDPLGMSQAPWFLACVDAPPRFRLFKNRSQASLDRTETLSTMHGIDDYARDH
ncbi:hypothetical protein BS17DRAFT_772226 [Gyrodon lividus]|nr:hypothetical protein BS17DRAFT_772226 [Gyrodon lividus]